MISPHTLLSPFKLSTLALLTLACLGPVTATPVIRQIPLNTTVPANVTLVNTTMHPPGSNGSAVTIMGVNQYGFDSFLAIPYAKPPLGDLRFAAPQPASYGASVNATTPAKACMQNPNDTTYGANLAGEYGVDEDCLTINVMAPGGAAANNTSLPVMVYIHGGGFYGGAGSSFLSPFLVGRGVENNRPFVLVTFNYRLGILGWGYGDEMLQNGAANLGLRDQILALEWVRDNVAAFGGDPERMTVFGESAGSISTSLLMLNESIGLFRGAIMQSGVQETVHQSPADDWETAYHGVAAIAGCNVTKASRDTSGRQSIFDCLKSRPVEDLMRASEAQFEFGYLWAPSVDGDLIPDAPYKLLAEGKFARVPFITGNCKDEGTAFVSPMLNSTEQVKAQLPSWYDNATIDEVLQQYPDEPALGCPFDTGNETFGLSSQYKRATAIQTDMSWHTPRQVFLRQANKHGWNQTWTYLWDAPVANIPAYLGITHGADGAYTFGAVSTAWNYTADEVELSNTLMDLWINFAYDLDPNADSDSNSNSTTQWSPHTWPENRNMLHFQPANLSLMQDDFREERMRVFFPPEAKDVAAGGGAA